MCGCCSEHFPYLKTHTNSKSAHETHRELRPHLDSPTNSPRLPPAPPARLGPSPRKCAGNVKIFGARTRFVRADGSKRRDGPRAQKRAMGALLHGCCWETCYIFAYCGLVVEIALIAANNCMFAPLPTSTELAGSQPSGSR